MKKFKIFDAIRISWVRYFDSEALFELVQQKLILYMIESGSPVQNGSFKAQKGSFEARF